MISAETGGEFITVSFVKDPVIGKTVTKEAENFPENIGTTSEGTYVF
jgi:hypothetical protein